MPTTEHHITLTTTTAQTARTVAEITPLGVAVITIMIPTVTTPVEARNITASTDHNCVHLKQLLPAAAIPAGVNTPITAGTADTTGHVRGQDPGQCPHT
jgi:hypothetical protein